MGMRGEVVRRRAEEGERVMRVGSSGEVGGRRGDGRGRGEVGEDWGIARGAGK